jgi:hypothetical protein
MSSLKAKRSSRTETPATTPAEVVIGHVIGVDNDGTPQVDYPGNPAATPLPALATARYHQVAAGSAVALMFVEGDRARPLAIGLVAPLEDKPPERLTLNAAREIALQCGRATVVLTSAGKVLIRGAYLSLRSSGMQRITGASVQIN